MKKRNGVDGPFSIRKYCTVSIFNYLSKKKNSWTFENEYYGCGHGSIAHCVPKFYLKYSIAPKLPIFEYSHFQIEILPLFNDRNL